MLTASRPSGRRAVRPSSGQARLSGRPLRNHSVSVRTILVLHYHNSLLRSFDRGQPSANREPRRLYCTLTRARTARTLLKQQCARFLGRASSDRRLCFEREDDAPLARSLRSCVLARSAVLRATAAYASS